MYLLLENANELSDRVWMGVWVAPGDDGRRPDADAADACAVRARRQEPI